MNNKDDMTSIDKLGAIEEWVNGIKQTLATESISWGEIAEVDHIYDSVKVFMEDN